MSAAEHAGRLTPDAVWNIGSRIVLSGDLGYRDAAAFWWWQVGPEGFDLIDYDEGTGMDAPEWIAKIKEHGIDIDHVYLPHDAKAKTMATRFTVIEQFAHAFECSIVPRSSLQDRINAARLVIPRCRFHPDNCSRGIEALRSWAFKYDEDRKIFSSEPEHNWASHGADGFSYGAQMIRELIRDDTKAAQRTYEGAVYPFSLEELHDTCGYQRNARM
jgi:phage terminase large subunit